MKKINREAIKSLLNNPDYMIDAEQGIIFDPITKKRKGEAVVPPGLHVLSYKFKGNYMTVYVHQVIWISVHGFFREKREGKYMAVRHKDGNYQNNRIENLYIGEHGMHDTKLQGEEVPGARLTNAQAEEIRNLYKSGMAKSVIGRRYGVHYNLIWKIVNNKTYKN